MILISISHYIICNISGFLFMLLSFHKSLVVILYLLICCCVFLRVFNSSLSMIPTWILTQAIFYYPFCLSSSFTWIASTKFYTSGMDQMLFYCLYIEQHFFVNFLFFLLIPFFLSSSTLKTVNCSPWLSKHCLPRLNCKWCCCLWSIKIAIPEPTTLDLSWYFLVFEPVIS